MVIHSNGLSASYDNGLSGSSRYTTPRAKCRSTIVWLKDWFFGGMKRAGPFCQRGLKVLKLLQLNKDKVWHINAFLADLVPPTMWIQSVQIQVMSFRGKLILIAKDFPFQCCSAESFPISKWISDISDRVKFLKWDEFVSIEFISTEHFFSDEELRLGATAALPELVTLIKRPFVLFCSPPHLASSIQDNRNQYYLRRMIVV